MLKTHSNKGRGHRGQLGYSVGRMRQSLKVQYVEFRMIKGRPERHHLRH